ncbi:hypothetical protein BJY52DRAFT_65233 [Lactarius psammicola]|nr:hypothetical protein BJY52DRAFT_65233 [Lactarius psammicola]
MDKRNLGGPMMLLWPWWMAKEAGRGKHTDATKSSPRNVPVLPLEIIEKVLREACEWPLNGAERQVLTAGALVCKSWLPLAQRLLYHSLIVENSLTDAFRNPGTFLPEALFHRSHLLRFTRSLAIRVPNEFAVTLPLFSEGDAPKGSRECVQIPDFFFLLAHTPRLRYLEIGVGWAESNIFPFEPHVLDWLSSLMLPIEALDLKSATFNSTFVNDLVNIWPTIRALSVVAGYLTLPLEGPSISLHQLRLFYPYSATVINWFLPPPLPNEQSNLRFLELYEILDEALPVLSVHGPSVSTLTLTRQPAFEIAHLFTKLEELVITGGFWSSPFHSLPKTLQHIRLHFTGVMSDPAVAAIAQVFSTLPDLRVLSIAEALTSNKDYPDLQEACEAHGVKILVYSVDSSGRAVHPYHLEMDRFPRQYTFSEFFDAGDRRP